jgi:hypothetical protein
MRATTDTTRWARWKATLTGEESLGVNSSEPGTNGTEERRAVWSRLSLVHKGAAGALVLLLLAPKPVHAQFGIDLAAILAALEKVQSMMSSYIAAPLQLIQKEQQSLSNYEHQVMYPVQKIQQAQNSVSRFENQFHQASGLFHINVSSATLPQSQNLESLLLSRNPANVGSVTGQYQSVYGVVMPQNAASPEVRNMTDMTDAQAQDAMIHANRHPGDWCNSVGKRWHSIFGERWRRCTARGSRHRCGKDPSIRVFVSIKDANSDDIALLPQYIFPEESA